MTLLDVALATYVDAAEGEVDDHLLAGALTRLGVSVAFVCWDDPDARWPAAGMVVVRSTRDFRERHEAFLGWADYVGSVTTLRNTAATIKWNSQKRYLLDLADRGVDIVPTRLAPLGELVSIMCIQGEPTHAVSETERVDLNDRHRALARAALGAVDETPLYARVDAVEVDGTMALMELDLIEPTLWLQWHPPAADVLAAAIVSQLTQSR